MWTAKNPFLWMKTGHTGCLLGKHSTAGFQPAFPVVKTLCQLQSELRTWLLPSWLPLPSPSGYCASAKLEWVNQEHTAGRNSVQKIWKVKGRTLSVNPL